jgi:hypothetical protein
MGLPVTVYRWDDVGAPQLSISPKPSEFIAVLKACLVDGYGTKTPLGWSVTLEDVTTRKVVFSSDVNTGASGGSVQFWSKDGSDSDGMRLYVRAAESIVSLDSFIKPSFLFEHYHGYQNSQWVIIGTTAGFYVFPHYSKTTVNYLNSGQYEVIYFVGDIDSNYPNDMGRFTVWAHSITSDLGSVNYSHSLAFVAGSNGGGGRLYGVDGNDTPIAYVNNASPMIVSKPSSNYTLESQGIVAALLPVLITASSTTSLDSDGIYCSFSSKNPYFRGVVPGLSLMPFNGYGDAQWPTERVIGGKNHQLLRGYFNGVWLNIEEWY